MVRVLLRGGVYPKRVAEGLQLSNGQDVHS